MLPRLNLWPITPLVWAVQIGPRQFGRVSIGTPGHIIYTPVLLARLTNDQIYLEVHRDVYKRAGDPLTSVQRIAGSEGMGQLLDWQQIEEVIRLKDGVAREVSQRPAGAVD
jgi:L,D-transpeptidase ErfK/SrfK